MHYRTIDGVPTNLDYEFVEPRTEIEELVAQIWRELLKRDRIGVHDNFFELGGHSLLATRVVARLQNNFQVDHSAAQTIRTAHGRRSGRVHR